MKIKCKVSPVLDDGFVPAVLWRRAFEEKVAADTGAHDVQIALGRIDGTTYRSDVRLLTHEGDSVALNVKYVERLIKFLLWAKGGCNIFIAGNDTLAAQIGEIYSETGSRKFDWDIIGDGMFSQNIKVIATTVDEIPAENSVAAETIVIVFKLL